MQAVRIRAAAAVTDDNCRRGFYDIRFSHGKILKLSQIGPVTGVAEVLIVVAVGAVANIIHAVLRMFELGAYKVVIGHHQGVVVGEDVALLLDPAGRIDNRPYSLVEEPLPARPISAVFVYEIVRIGEVFPLHPVGREGAVLLSVHHTGQRQSFDVRQTHDRAGASPDTTQDGHQNTHQQGNYAYHDQKLDKRECSGAVSLVHHDLIIPYLARFWS